MDRSAQTVTATAIGLKTLSTILRDDDLPAAAIGETLARLGEVANWLSSAVQTGQAGMVARVVDKRAEIADAGRFQEQRMHAMRRSLTTVIGHLDQAATLLYRSREDLAQLVDREAVPA